MIARALVFLLMIFPFMDAPQKSAHAAPTVELRRLYSFGINTIHDVTVEVSEHREEGILLRSDARIRFKAVACDATDFGYEYPYRELINETTRLKFRKIIPPNGKFSCKAGLYEFVLNLPVVPWRHCDLSSGVDPECAPGRINYAEYRFEDFGKDVVVRVRAKMAESSVDYDYEVLDDPLPAPASVRSARTSPR